MKDAMEDKQQQQQRHSIAGVSPVNSNSSRRRPSFLHIPDTTNWRGSLSQLHLPTFSLTTPEGDQSRKFNFGLIIRRHSHHVRNMWNCICYKISTKITKICIICLMKRMLEL